MSQLLDPERKLSFYFQEMLNTYTESIQNRLKSVQAKAQGTLEELEKQSAGIVPQLTGEEIAEYIRETLVPLRAEQQAEAEWHGRLLTDITRITRGTEQKQILEAVLAATAGISDRALILLVRQGQVSGWEGRGYRPVFVESGLKTFSAAVAADAVISSLIEGTGGRTFIKEDLPAGARYLEIADFEKPAKFHVFPLVLFGSVAAVLFIDGDGCRIGDAEAVQAGETIMTTTAIWLENLAMRKSLGLGLPGMGPVVAEPEVDVYAAVPPTVIDEPPTAKTVQAAEPAADEWIEEPVEEPAVEPAAELFEEPVSAPGEPPAAEPAPVVEAFMPVEIPADPDKSLAATREFPVEEQVDELDLTGFSTGPEEYEIQLEEPPAAPAVPAPDGELSLMDQVMRIESLGEEEIVVDEEAAPTAAPAMFETEPEEIVLEEAGDMGYAPSMDISPGPAMPVTEEPEEIVLEEHPLEELILEETPAAPSFQAPEPAFTPPAPAAPPVSTQPWTTPEEERQYNDARRFARLLVSEIKLYNEDSVTEGRIEKDLYRRLQKDIDRSREMFDKRVPRSLGLKIDYFHEELVRILAEGDSAKLGRGYPGPVNQ